MIRKGFENDKPFELLVKQDSREEDTPKVSDSQVVRKSSPFKA